MPMSKIRFPRYFHRKSDIKALIVLVLLVVVCVGFFWLASDRAETHDVEQTADSIEGKTREKAAEREQEPFYYDQGQPKAERFVFDPNTADSTQLLRLGLSPYMVRGIYRYRAKGGIYRRAEDFGKVPGLTQKQYRELKPYIRISSDYLPAADLAEVRSHPERDTLRAYHKTNELHSVSPNCADTAQLMRVPGIGSYYARNIIRYGEKLGGYVSVDQLSEIEDFPEESKKYFVVEEVNVKKMNVNRLTLNQLKRHPYMGFYRARAINEYRRLHGPLKSLTELRLLPEFSPEAISRLEPYVEY